MGTFFKGKFMENTVFISNVDKQEAKIKGYSKLRFEIYDKNGETDVFCTSTMSDYHADKYLLDANKVLGIESPFKNKFGVYLISLEQVKDDDKNLVGLKCKNGILLKNEVQQKTFINNNELLLQL